MCTTPAPLSIPPSPGLRLFPWYDIYEKYIDLSMAGASAVQSHDVRSILRWLTIPFDNYEAQCRFGKDRERKSYGFVTQWDSVLLCRAFSLRDFRLRYAMLARRISGWVVEVYRSQKLGTIGLNYLGTLDNGNHSLPASNPTGQVVVLWAVRIATTMYRENGQRDKAISLLETVIHLFGPDVDLENAEIWFYYNEIVIELAHCCAEDGHQDEARDLLENKIEFPSSLRGSSHFEETTVRFFRRILRRSKEDALQFVRELENGRGGIRSRQEHHARLQEGSSQPEASEWGPFLTD